MIDHTHCYCGFGSNLHLVCCVCRAYAPFRAHSNWIVDGATHAVFQDTKIKYERWDPDLRVEVDTTYPFADTAGSVGVADVPVLLSDTEAALALREVGVTDVERRVEALKKRGVTLCKHGIS